MRAPLWLKWGAGSPGSSGPRGSSRARRSNRGRQRAVAVALSILTLGARVAAEDREPSGVVAGVSDVRVDDAMRRAQRLLLERAKQRYEAGRGAGDEEAARHLESALDALDLAYRLAPAPWLLFNMAQVESQLGACREASELYHRFIASEPAPEAKRNAQQALELLGPCDESRPPRVEGGLAPGLRVPSSLDAIFLGHGLAAAEGAPSATPTPELAEEHGLVHALPWAFGSLSIISGVAGAIYYGAAIDAKHDLDDIRIAGPNVARTQERGESAQNLSRVFGGFAVGFALAAGASYLWSRPARDEAPLESLEHLSWVPIEGGAGASYRGEF